MVRQVWIGLLTAGLALVLAQATQAESKAGHEAGENVLKVVVHMNFPESGRQGHGLKNIANILKEAPDTRIEVVCHGAGLGLVENARTEHADSVRALIAKGVRFVACENTMRQKSIRKDELVPGVGTVPSGAVEVIRKQQKDGFSYFKP
jgi:intracellular sulfur oxidation DsrE/DsrF family protein